jgi:hypothetical protein
MSQQYQALRFSSRGEALQAIDYWNRILLKSTNKIQRYSASVRLKNIKKWLATEEVKK